MIKDRLRDLEENWDARVNELTPIRAETRYIAAVRSQ